MASGKSAVGNNLSIDNGFKFIDLDSYIEKKEKLTIPKIFNQKGEIYFRTVEHNYLKSIIKKNDDFVMALGGGTPCYAGNMELILSQKNTVVVYLKASVKTIISRVLLETKKRPLIADIPKNELKEYISKHLFERSFFYEQAHYKVSTNNKPIKKITSEIEKLLQENSYTFI